MHSKYHLKKSIDQLDYFWSNKFYDFLKENFFEIIDSMNYEICIFEDEEKVIIIEKNTAATAVAEIIEPELAYEVIQYNHYLMKGNIEGKSAIEYVKNLSEEEREYWYDETYQLILLCILEYDNIERTKKITELKKKVT